MVGGVWLYGGYVYDMKFLDTSYIEQRLVGIQGDRDRVANSSILRYFRDGRLDCWLCLVYGVYLVEE